MKKNRNIIRQITVLIICMGALLNNAAAQKTFDETLDIHLNAIRNANLKEFEPTVADGILHISPMGDMNQSKAKFIKLHEDWFKKTNWQWDGVIVKKSSNGSLGYAMISYSYLEKNAEGKELFKIKCYLNLIFSKSDKGWQLVYDQNTIIPEKK